MTDRVPALDHQPAETVRLPAEDSPAAPTLVAGPRPELFGTAKRPSVLPILVSFCLHAAALFLFADLSDQLPDRPRIPEPPAIMVDIVIDMPLHEAIPVAESAEINSLQETPLQVADAAIPVDVTPVVPVPAVTEAAPSALPPELPPVAEPAGAVQAAADFAAAPEAIEPAVAPVETPALVASAVEEPVHVIEASAPAFETAGLLDSPPANLRPTPVFPPSDAVVAVEVATIPGEPSSSAPAVVPAEALPAIDAARPLDLVFSPEPATIKSIEATPLFAQSSEQPRILAAPVPEVNVAPATPVSEPNVLAEARIAPMAPAPGNLAPETASAVIGEVLVAATAPLQETTVVSAPAPSAVASPRPELIPVLTPSEPSTALQGEERRETAALVSPPLVRPALDPRSAVAQAITGLDCARVRTRWESADGAVSISGHLRSSEDRDRLVQALSEIPGVKRVVNSDLHIVGEPYCRVLAFLHQPGLAQSSDQKQGLEALGSPAQAGVVRFKAGMPLELQLTGPNFAAYVYVDYFTADGQVYHLLPTRNLTDHRVEPKEMFTVGGRSGRGLKATIGPPFGLDMVVAVASARRLFPDARPTAENGKDYLSALDAVLAEARRRDPSLQLEYAYYLVQTSAN